MTRAKEKKAVAYYYAAFRVNSDGSIDVSLKDEMSYLADAQTGVRAVHAHPDAAEVLLTNVFWGHGETDSYTPPRPISEQEARYVAEQLPRRLERELGPVLLRSRPSGPRIYGTKARPRRVSHGLSEDQLVEFANLCAALKLETDPTGAREAAAQRVGIAPTYGGAPGSKSRRVALWKLEKRGKGLSSGPVPG